MLSGSVQWLSNNTLRAGGDSWADGLRNSLMHVGAGVLACSIGKCGLQIEEICLTLAPQPALDERYVIIGRVYDGMDVLRRIAALQVDENEKLFASVDCSVLSLSWKTKKSLEQVRDERVLAPRSCQSSLLKDFV